MNYWHMQLHPDNSDDSTPEEYIKILKLGIIGMDVWKEGNQANPQQTNFKKKLKENDVVLVRLGYTPIALVQVKSKYFEIHSDLEEFNWMVRRRHIDVIGYADESIKNNKFPIAQGTFKKSTDQKSPSYQYILNWHNALNKKRFKEWISINKKELDSVSIDTYMREYDKIHNICNDDVNIMNLCQWTLDDYKQNADKVRITDRYKTLMDRRKTNGRIGTVLKLYEKFLERKKSVNIIKTLKSQKQIILQGPPGTGKTYLAKQIANEFCENKENQEIIIFHPSYGYEDFIRGIEAKTDKNGNISYEVVDKVLIKMASKALASKNENFVLIIDEINRANLSAVLGELIYALEYRGEPANCMYEKNGSREIILPENLYIIGTMNTADRSVGYIDYAIRRRFAFVDVLADKSLVSSESRFDEVREIIKEEISSEYNVDDIMIGHSYFMGENLEEKMKYQVMPLLKEYVKDGLLTPQVEEKIKKLED